MVRVLLQHWTGEEDMVSPLCISYVTIQYI